MADKKISDLTALTTASESDVLAIVNSGDTKKIARSDLLKVVDTLVSTSAVNPLSANQGKQLKDSTDTAISLIDYRGIKEWATSHAYLVNDIVHYNSLPYKCLIGHTSGTFATDLTAGDWVLMAAVSSVFTRTGAVVAAASDYNASQVDNDSTVVGTYVSDALNTLKGAIEAEDVWDRNGTSGYIFQKVLADKVGIGTITPGYLLHVNAGAIFNDGVGAAITTSGDVQGANVNGVSALKLNGTNINTAGTLTNVAYKGQNNSFTVGQTITGDSSIDGALVVNESGADKDTRIEGDTDADLVHVDANTDRVGIGIAAPVYKLDVNGDVNVAAGSAFLINTASINTSGTLTNVAYLSQANTFTANQTVSNAGTNSNSYKVSLIANSATTSQTGSLEVAYGADPYLRISAPNDAGAETAVLDLHDTVFNLVPDATIDIGQTAAGRPKDIFASGTVKATNINGTTAIQLNGTDINTAGTLTNVAYENQANTFTGNQTLSNGGTDTDSYKLLLIANNSTTPQTGSIVAVHAADPYLRISAPSDAGAETAVLDIHDTLFSFVPDATVDIGATAAGRPKDVFASGTVKATTLNGTTAIQLNGTDINTAGTLSGVAYKAQANSFTGDQTLSNAGNNTNSYKLVLVANAGGVAQTGSIVAAYGADPYLRVSAPNDSGTETAVLDIHDTALAFVTDNTVDIGATAAGRPKDIFASGTVKAVNVNGTTAIQLNGTDINTTNTLSNVAYKGQDNSFTVGQTITGDSSIDGALIVNETGADKDCRIEGDTDANLIYTDAGNNRVGLGTASPGEKLHVVGAVHLDDATPVSTANALYSTSSALYWNGLPVVGGGSGGASRQTVLQGRVASTGAANFVETVSALNVSVYAAVASPLLISYANGFISNGASDYIEQTTSANTVACTDDDTSYVYKTYGSAPAKTLTAPLYQPVLPNSEILLHFDTSLTLDSGTAGNTWTTAGNVALDTTGKFGAKSALFTDTTGANGDKISSSFTLTGGAFTIECWYRLDALATTIDNPFCLFASSDDYGFILSFNPAQAYALRKYRLWASSNHSSWNIGSGADDGTEVTAVIGEWHHVALTYDGSNYRVWHDGVKVNEYAGAALAGSSIWIGRCPIPDNHPFYGAIDEVRYVDECLYTATFTPATASYLPDGTSTNPTFLYHTPAGVMYTSTGGAWSATKTVFLGEVVAAGGSVSSINTYALRGFYDSGNTATAAAGTTLEHNLGIEDATASLWEGTAGSKTQIMSKDFTLTPTDVTWTAVSGTSRVQVKRNW